MTLGTNIFRNLIHKYQGTGLSSYSSQAKRIDVTRLFNNEINLFTNNAMLGFTIINIITFYINIKQEKLYFRYL